MNDPKEKHRRLFLTAEWRHLVMLNYVVDPALLASRTPPGVEIDSFNGQTYVSMVGFMFLDTRVLGVPIPFHRNFEEVNLRFYVRRKTGDVVRRGVVFVRELVPRWAIATVARVFYNEPYAAMPMRHSIATSAGMLSAGSQVEYGWRHSGSWNTLQAQTAGVAALPAENSLDQFITEHYWGYSLQRDGGCKEYEVAHPPWMVWPVANSRLDCDINNIYGHEFAPYLSVSPKSAFVAEGSRVEVYSGGRLN